MKLLVAFAVLAACLAAASAEKRIVCYFISWAIYRQDLGKYQASDVDASLCTHLLYANIGLNPNGTVRVLDDWEFTGLMEMAHLQTLKTTYPDLKLMVSLGGWTEGSEIFSQVAADATLTQNMIDSAIDFVQTNQFDGLDLDWEYPGQQNGSNPTADPINVGTLVTKVGAAVKAQSLIFSVGVSGIVWFEQNGYNSGAVISAAADFINVKSIDYHGNWETVTGHYAPLHPAATDADQAQNVAAGLQRWITMGADPAKLNIGIGSYGRPFTLSSTASVGLNAPVLGAGVLGNWTQEEGLWGYNEICYFYNDFTYVWDDVQQVPHSYKGDQWVGYDDEDSIIAKLTFAKSLGIGGVWFNSLDTDDFAGLCGDKYPLLTAVNNNWS